MGGRRQERRPERPPAQGQRLGAMHVQKARGGFAGIGGWRLRYPRVQAPLKMEELVQSQLATWLEDRTQAPSEKTPHRTASLRPQQSQMARLR